MIVERLAVQIAFHKARNEYKGWHRMHRYRLNTSRWAMKNDIDLAFRKTHLSKSQYKTHTPQPQPVRHGIPLHDILQCKRDM